MENHPNETEGREGWRVRSVTKALHILELFTPAQTELSLAQRGRARV